MGGQRRSTVVHNLAQDLSARWGVPIEATYDTGTKWQFRWTDGPSRDTVAAAVKSADTAGADVSFWRSFSDRAVALGIIRFTSSGEFDGHPTLGTEWELRAVEFPERAAGAREERMVARLLTAATSQHGYVSDRAMGDLVRDRGLAWLLDSDGPAVDGSSTAGAAAELTPIEVLTKRYAQGRAARAWTQRAETMPLREAVDAALADPRLDETAAVAVLAVLPDLRAELEHLEVRAVTAARDAGASWADVGAAFGLSRQAAQQSYERRVAGASARRTPNGRG